MFRGNASLVLPVLQVSMQRTVGCQHAVELANRRVQYASPFPLRPSTILLCVVFLTLPHPTSLIFANLLPRSNGDRSRSHTTQHTHTHTHTHTHCIQVTYHIFITYHILKARAKMRTRKLLYCYSTVQTVHFFGGDLVYSCTAAGCERASGAKVRAQTNVASYSS